MRHIHLLNKNHLQFEMSSTDLVQIYSEGIWLMRFIRFGRSVFQITSG